MAFEFRSHLVDEYPQLIKKSFMYEPLGTTCQVATILRNTGDLSSYSPYDNFYSDSLHHGFIERDSSGGTSIELISKVP